MKHKPIPKSIRLEVYEKCNHRCAYCGCELAYKDMQVDHLIALENGGDDSLENYMPSCRQCNFYKHTYDIETFRYCLENIIMKKVIGLFQFRLAEKYGLVERHDKKIKFYFEELEEVLVEENAIDIELPSEKETREQVQQQLRYVKKSLKEVCEAVPNIKDWEECSELDISYLTVIINGIAKDLEKAYEVTSDYHRLNNPICNDEDEYEDEEPGDWYEGDESFSSMFGEDNYD